MEESSLSETIMSKELYEAALCGDSEFIDNTENDPYLLQKTFVGNNIIHLAMRHGNITFVGEALIRVPHLMWEPNMDGNTPLHVAAEMGYVELVKRLCDSFPTLCPLRKNSTGNTPLHVALIHTEIEIAVILVEKNPEIETLSGYRP